MAGFEIRAYQHPDDYQGLAEVLGEADMLDPDYESPEKLREYSDNHPDNIIVATISNQIVGTIYLQDSDIIPTLNRLAVSSPHRRRSIGTQLVQAAERQAQIHGNKFLEVYVDQVNEDAQKFWEAQGYQPGHMYKNLSKKLSS